MANSSIYGRSLPSFRLRLEPGADIVSVPCNRPSCPICLDLSLWNDPPAETHNSLEDVLVRNAIAGEIRKSSDSGCALCTIILRASRLFTNDDGKELSFNLRDRSAVLDGNWFISKFEDNQARILPSLRADWATLAKAKVPAMFFLLQTQRKQHDL
jgi:hypothetical protein